MDIIPLSLLNIIKKYRVNYININIIIVSKWENNMVIVLYILAVLLVWIIGITSFSFVNTVTYRFPKNKPIVKEHFCCDKCGQQLRAPEVIPVFSYIALKGRCRYCGENISKRDFINEIMGGFAALLVFFRFGHMGELGDIFKLSSLLDIIVLFNIQKLVSLLTIFLFFCIMDLVILVDYDTMEIPNRFVIVMLYVSVAALVFVPGISIVNHLIGAVCISVPMLMIMLAIPGAFGGGDLKLTAAVGLFLGWQLTIIGFLLGLLFGGIYGIVKLAGKKLQKGDHFSFGPFLCGGYMMAAICGMDLINAYLKLASILHG